MLDVASSFLAVFYVDTKEISIEGMIPKKEKESENGRNIPRLSEG